MPSENPFDKIDSRLSAIEKMLKDKIEPVKVSGGADLLRYIPVREIFERKICSESTFYAHHRAGEFEIYKFGNLSFVDREEFEKAFKPAGLIKVA